MTVKQVIKRLQKMPQNAQVIFRAHDQYLYEGEHIRTIKLFTKDELEDVRPDAGSFAFGRNNKDEMVASVFDSGKEWVVFQQ